MGVWDTSVDPEITLPLLPDMLNWNRKRQCFFIRRRIGMSFEAAKTLQERSSQREDLKRTLLVATAAVVVSTVGILVNIALRVVCGP